MSSDSSPIRVLVVDDHQLIRFGIGTLLLPESDMKLVGEASNGREAISKFRECDPDIALMDPQMPEDGLGIAMAVAVIEVTATGIVKIYRDLDQAYAAAVTIVKAVDQVEIAPSRVDCNCKMLTRDPGRIDIIQHMETVCG